MCAQGGLSNIYSVVGIYNKDEIKQHLNQLALGIRSAALGENEPIGVKLSGNKHAMGLCYYASSNQWVLKDINQKATIETDNLELDDVVSRIFDGFRLVAFTEQSSSDKVDDDGDLMEQSLSEKIDDDGDEHEEQKLIEFDEDDSDKLCIIDDIINELHNAEKSGVSSISMSLSPSDIVVTFCKNDQNFWQIKGEEPIATPSDDQNRENHNIRLPNKAFDLMFLSSPYVVLDTRVILSAANENEHLIACLKDKAPQQEPTEEIIKTHHTHRRLKSGPSCR